MSIIPLDLQRRFEQRWAARFPQPVPPAAPEKHRQDLHLAAPNRGKRKARRVKPTGFRSVPAV
jgi:hypothetical protein